MSENSSQPATIGDVHRIVTETEHRLIEIVTETEHRLIEAMRQMQTELLRGFEAFSHAQNLRIRKVEADQSNLDTSLSGRVEILENRLHQIEMKLGKAS